MPLLPGMQEESRMIRDLIRDLLCYDGMDVSNVDEIADALAEEIDKTNKEVVRIINYLGITGGKSDRL